MLYSGVKVLVLIVIQDKSAPATIVEEVQSATNQMPVDCKASWFVCVCLSLANGICCGTCYVYGIFFPRILDEFQAGKAVTALPGSLSVAFLCLLSPISLYFVKRYGGRVSIPIGGVICGLGLLASSFGTNIFMVCFTYGFVLASSACLIYTAGFMTVPLYFKKHRSFAVGMVSAGPGAGFLLMSPISESLLKHLGWRKAMMSLGGINLISCFLGCGITRGVHGPRVAPAQGSVRVTMVLSDVLSSLKSVLKDPLLVLVFVLTFLIGLAHEMPLVHWIKYADELGISSQESSWMYTIKGALSTLCKVIIGKICDTGRISPYHIFQSGALLMALNDFMLPMSRKLGHLYGYAAIQGLSEAAYSTPLYCLSMTLNPEHGISWLLFFYAIPVFCSAPIAGVIADLSHSYIPVFYTAGSLFVLMILITFSRHCVHRHPRIQALPVAMSIG